MKDLERLILDIGFIGEDYHIVVIDFPYIETRPQNVMICQFLGPLGTLGKVIGTSVWRVETNQIKQMLFTIIQKSYT